MKSKRTKEEQVALDKMDKEFDYFEMVITLERIETERARAAQGKRVIETPLGFRKHEGNYTDERKKEVFSKKIQLGGKSEGEEKRLKAKLLKDMKDEGFKEDLSAVKARAGRLGGKKSKGGGRKKGTTFDKELGRFVSAEEREEIKKGRKNK